MTAAKPKTTKRKRKKPRKLTPQRERWVEEHIKQKGEDPDIATRIAYPNQTRGAQKVTTHRLMHSEEVQARIRKKVEAASNVTAAEVIGTLTLQMRTDVTDSINDKGEFDFKLLRKRGLGHLVQTIEKTDFENAKGKPVTRSRVTFHSAQAAAMSLARLMGLEKEMKQYEREARKRMAIANVIQDYADRRGISFEQAAKSYLIANPDQAKYVNGNGNGKVTEVDGVM